jgi:hypothetical protein
VLHCTGQCVALQLPVLCLPDSWVFFLLFQIPTDYTFKISMMEAVVTNTCRENVPLHTITCDLLTV